VLPRRIWTGSSSGSVARRLLRAERGDAENAADVRAERALALA